MCENSLATAIRLKFYILQTIDCGYKQVVHRNVGSCSHETAPLTL